MKYRPGSPLQGPGIVVKAELGGNQAISVKISLYVFSWISSESSNNNNAKITLEGKTEVERNCQILLACSAEDPTM